MTPFAAESSATTVPQWRWPSPQAFAPSITAPATAEEAAGLMARVESLLQLAAAGPPLLRQLAEFLGANSRAWTLDNRARLRRVLACAGPTAMTEVLAVMNDTPRTDVLDEGELVLKALPPNAARHLVTFAHTKAVHPSVRACVLRAVARLDALEGQRAVRIALTDFEPEIREAAASLVTELRVRNGRAILENVLHREEDPVVQDALRDALHSLGA